MGSLNIPNLVPGKKYALQIRSIGADGTTSAWSETISFTSPENLNTQLTNSYNTTLANSGQLVAGTMKFGLKVDPTSTYNGIYIGSNDYWYDNGNFSLGSGGVKWNGTTLEVSGKVTATDGFIAGWSIGTSEIFKGTGSTKIALNSDAYNGTTNLTGPRIYVGAGSYASSTTPFYADSQGYFSLADKLYWNPTDTQSFGKLTVVGRISGAIDNVPVSPNDSGTVYLGNIVITSTGSNQQAVVSTFTNSGGTLTATSPPFLAQDTVIIANIPNSSGASSVEGAWVITSVDSSNKTFTIQSNSTSAWTTGSYDTQTTKTLTKAGDGSATTPSPTIFVNSTTDIEVGHYVFGTNIPDGTTVTAIGTKLDTDGITTLYSVTLSTALTTSLSNGATVKFLSSARVREMTLGLHPASNGSPAGYGVRLDKDNYWFVNNNWKVGAGSSYVKWDGSILETSGKVTATSGSIGGWNIDSSSLQHVFANSSIGTGTFKIYTGTTNSSIDNPYISVFTGTSPAFSTENTKFYISGDGKFSLGTAFTYTPGTNAAAARLEITGKLQGQQGWLGSSSGWNWDVTGILQSGSGATKIAMASNSAKNTVVTIPDTSAINIPRLLIDDEYPDYLQPWGTIYYEANLSKLDYGYYANNPDDLYDQSVKFSLTTSNAASTVLNGKSLTIQGVEDYRAFFVAENPIYGTPPQPNVQVTTSLTPIYISRSGTTVSLYFDEYLTGWTGWNTTYSGSTINNMGKLSIYIDSAGFNGTINAATAASIMQIGKSNDILNITNSGNGSSGGILTITTDMNHNFALNDIVTIVGVNPFQYNLNGKVTSNNTVGTTNIVTVDTKITTGTISGTSGQTTITAAYLTTNKESVAYGGGTVTAVSGNNATITGMTTTKGLFVGAPITATAGTGNLGTQTFITGIINDTSITVTAIATAPVAGTVTAIASLPIFSGMAITGTGIGTNARISTILGNTLTLTVANSGTVSGTATIIPDSTYTNTDLSTGTLVGYVSGGRIDYEYAQGSITWTYYSADGQNYSVMNITSVGSGTIALTDDFSAIVYKTLNGNIRTLESYPEDSGLNVHSPAAQGIYTYSGGNGSNGSAITSAKGTITTSTQGSFSFFDYQAPALTQTNTTRYHIWAGSDDPSLAGLKIYKENDSTSKVVVQASAGTTPIGTVNMWPTATPPDGWKICNGQALSRTTYKSLYDTIGTTFGTGDGTTTFNIPDYQGLFPLGAGTGTAPAYSSVTLNAKGGSATTSIAHTHTFADNSSSTNTDTHSHNANSGPVDAGNASVATGTGVSMASPNHTHGFTTASDTHSHTVAVSGTTGGASAATITPIPPYFGINFIIYTGVIG